VGLIKHTGSEYFVVRDSARIFRLGGVKSKFRGWSRVLHGYYQLLSAKRLKLGGGSLMDLGLTLSTGAGVWRNHWL